VLCVRCHGAQGGGGVEPISSGAGAMPRYLRDPGPSTVPDTTEVIN